MRKGILATLCVLALAVMGSAQAGDTELPLNVPEKAGWCALETVLATVADIVEHQGCDATKGQYDVGLDIGHNGNGTGFVDNVDLTILLVEQSTKGEKFEVYGDGDLDNVDLDPQELVGKCANNTIGDILIGSGKIKISGVKYDWTFIKDLYEKQLPGTQPPDCECPPIPGKIIIIDKGLEAITKLGYPRQKYRQVSRYTRPDGGDGKIWVKKDRIAPTYASSCTIILKNLRADNAGEGLQVWGKVWVK